MGDAKITILTAADFESSTEFKRASNEQRADATGSPGGTAQQAATTGTVQTAPTGAERTDHATPVGATDVASHQPAHQTTSEQAPASGDVDIGQTNENGASNAVAGESSVEAERPIPQQVNVALGQSNGVEVDWEPSTKGSPHLFVVGIPGQGKSWTVTRIVTELGRQGVPSLIIDFHGQFADSNEPFVRAVGPTVVDASEGPPFSPFECDLAASASDWKAGAYEIAEIFGYVARLGDIQQDAIYEAVRDAYQAAGFGTSASEDLQLPTIDDVRRRIEHRERLHQVQNVTARCRPLLEMDLFRPVPRQSDLISTVRRGLVIDLHKLRLESVEVAAGAFILRKLYRDMFRWGVADHIRLVIVLDEAHRLARDGTLPKIMKEGRKFGVAVVVASQGMSDFPDEVLQNAGTKVVFRTNHPESRKLAGFIRSHVGTNVADRIEQLAVGTAYVQTSDMPLGAPVKMYAPNS